jgi:hypothetical protein
MDRLIAIMEEQFSILKVENEKLKNGNKSAGTRARGAAMLINKATKEYRQAVTDAKTKI